jgi:hypothetical protein
MRGAEPAETAKPHGSGHDFRRIGATPRDQRKAKPAPPRGEIGATFYGVPKDCEGLVVASDRLEDGGAFGVHVAAIWIAIAFWPARVAARKGHSFFGYFIFSLIFFPAALIVAYLVSDRTAMA